MRAALASIPAPSVRDIELGPLDIRLYALCLLAGVAAAVWITTVRWKAQGGEPELVLEVALWSVLFGLIGGQPLPRHHELGGDGDEWYAPIAIWEGGPASGAGSLGVAVGAYVPTGAGRACWR